MTTETAPAAAPQETLGFQAEVSQLLKMMIHSLYSNREIFLRELISNASDACDKLRFEALADPAYYEGQPELHVSVDFDAAAGTVTIEDTGIGLTREEAVSNLGTIARSGTAEFLGRLTGDQKKDAQLIGQFGVGFYSGFIVAERIEVFSRKAGQPASAGVRWESRGEGEFTVETVARAERGTRIVLHLKEDSKEYADGWRLRSLVRKYADHIAFPVRMRPTGEKKDDTPEWESVNDARALWTRSKSELTDEDYTEFYKRLSHDFEAPLSWSHHRVEGKREYTALVYIPGRAPFDLWNRDAPRGLKLYVKRVFILDDAEQFLPLYLRFVKGVVDSADLPLNVSRELLQHDPEAEAMRGGITRKVLDLLAKLAEDEPEKYAKFWKDFGGVLKEGPAEDHANRERIAKLLRFATTHTGSETPDQSLAGYLGRMQSGQKHLYYVTADTFNAAANSPHLERLRAKNIEVILLYERIDGWLMSHLTEFDGKTFRDVARGDLDLGELESADEKQAREGVAEQASGLCARLKAALGDRVEDVRATERLAESASCLVRDENDYGLQMRRMMEAAGQALPPSLPVLEVNAAHPLLQKLAALPDGEAFNDLALMVQEQALLAEGSALPEPAAFVRRLNKLLAGG